MVSFENAPSGSGICDVFVRVFSLRDSQQVGKALVLDNLELKFEGKQRLTNKSCACRFVADNKVLFVSAARYNNRKNQFILLTWDKKQLVLDTATQKPKDLTNDDNEVSKHRYVSIDDGRAHGHDMHGVGIDVNVVLWNPEDTVSTTEEINMETLDGDNEDEDSGDEASSSSSKDFALLGTSSKDYRTSLEIYKIRTANPEETFLVLTHSGLHRNTTDESLRSGVAGVCCAVSSTYVAYAVDRPLKLKRPKHLRSKPLPSNHVGQMIVRSLPKKENANLLNHVKKDLKNIQDKLPRHLRQREDAQMQFKYRVDQLSSCAFCGNLLVAGSGPCVVDEAELSTELQRSVQSTRASNRVVVWDLHYESEIWSFEWGQFPLLELSASITCVALNEDYVVAGLQYFVPNDVYEQICDQDGQEGASRWSHFEISKWDLKTGQLVDFQQTLDAKLECTCLSHRKQASYLVSGRQTGLKQLPCRQPSFSAGDVQRRRWRSDERRVVMAGGGDVDFTWKTELERKLIPKKVRHAHELVAREICGTKHVNHTHHSVSPYQRALSAVAAKHGKHTPKAKADFSTVLVGDAHIKQFVGDREEHEINAHSRCRLSPDGKFMAVSVKWQGQAFSPRAGSASGGSIGGSGIKEEESDLMDVVMVHDLQHGRLLFSVRHVGGIVGFEIKQFKSGKTLEDKGFGSCQLLTAAVDGSVVGWEIVGATAHAKAADGRDIKPFHVHVKDKIFYEGLREDNATTMSPAGLVMESRKTSGGTLNCVFQWGCPKANEILSCGRPSCGADGNGFCKKCRRITAFACDGVDNPFVAVCVSQDVKKGGLLYERKMSVYLLAIVPPTHHGSRSEDSEFRLDYLYHGDAKHMNMDRVHLGDSAQEHGRRRGLQGEHWHINNASFSSSRTYGRRVKSKGKAKEGNKMCLLALSVTSDLDYSEVQEQCPRCTIEAGDPFCKMCKRTEGQLCLFTLRYTDLKIHRAVETKGADAYAAADSEHRKSAEATMKLRPTTQYDITARKSDGRSGSQATYSKGSESKKGERGSKKGKKGGEGKKTPGNGDDDDDDDDNDNDNEGADLPVKFAARHSSRGLTASSSIANDDGAITAIAWSQDGNLLAYGIHRKVEVVDLTDVCEDKELEPKVCTLTDTGKKEGMVTDLCFFNYEHHGMGVSAQGEEGLDHNSGIQTGVNRIGRGIDFHHPDDVRCFCGNEHDDPACAMYSHSVSDVFNYRAKCPGLRASKDMKNSTDFRLPCLRHRVVDQEDDAVKAAQEDRETNHAPRAIDKREDAARCQWGEQWADDPGDAARSKWWTENFKRRLEGQFLAIGGTNMYLSIYELKSGRAVYASKHAEGSPSVCFAHAPLTFKGAEHGVDIHKDVHVEGADHGIHMVSEVFPLVYVSKDTNFHPAGADDANDVPGLVGATAKTHALGALGALGDSHRHLDVDARAKNSKNSKVPAIAEESELLISTKDGDEHKDAQREANRSLFTIRMMDVQRLFLFGPSVEHAIELIEPTNLQRNWLETPSAHYLQDFLYFYPTMVNRQQAIPQSLREDQLQMNSAIRAKAKRGGNKAFAISTMSSQKSFRLEDTKKKHKRKKHSTVPTALSPGNDAKHEDSDDENGETEMEMYEKSLRSVILSSLSAGPHRNKPAVRLMIGNSDNTIIAMRGTYFQRAIDDNDPLSMIGEMLVAAGDKTLCWGRKEVVDKIPNIVKPNGRDDSDNQEKVLLWLNSLEFTRTDLAIEDFKGALSGDDKSVVRMSQHGCGTVEARHMFDDFYYDPQVSANKDDRDDDRDLTKQEKEERQKDDSIVPLACKQLMWPGLGDKKVLAALTECQLEGMFENAVMGVLLDGLYIKYATQQLMSELFLYLCFIACFTIFALKKTPDTMEASWQQLIDDYNGELDFLLCFVLTNFALMFLAREGKDMWDGFGRASHRNGKIPRLWPLFDSHYRTSVIVDEGKKGGHWWLFGRWWIIHHGLNTGSDNGGNSGNGNKVSAENDRSPLKRSAPMKRSASMSSTALGSYGRLTPKTVHHRVLFGRMWCVLICSTIVGSLVVAAIIGEASLMTCLTYSIAAILSLCGMPLGYNTMLGRATLQPAWLGAVCGGFAGWALGFQFINALDEFFEQAGSHHTVMPVFLISVVLFFMTYVDLEIDLGHYMPKILNRSLKISIDTKLWYEEWLEFFQEPLDISYFKSSWNYLDLLASLATIASIVQFCVLLTCNSEPEVAYAVHYECTTQRRIFASVLAVTAMFLWANFLFFLRGLKETGYLMRAVMNIGNDIVPFGSVLIVVLLCFSVTFQLLFNLVDVDAYYADTGEEFPFRDFFHTFINVFCVMLGDFDLHIISFYSANSDLALLVFTTYALCVSVVLLNMLIALISDSYARVQRNAAANGQRERAIVNLEMFDLLNEADQSKMQRECLWTYVLVQEADIDQNFASGQQKRSKESDLKHALMEETKSLIGKTEASVNSTMQALKDQQTLLVSKVEKLIQAQEQNMQYMQNKHTQQEIGRWDNNGAGMHSGGGVMPPPSGMPHRQNSGRNALAGYAPQIGEEDVNDQNAKELLWAELRNKKKKRIRARVKREGEKSDSGPSKDQGQGDGDGDGDGDGSRTE
jgi:hypothetical protein